MRALPTLVVLATLAGCVAAPPAVEDVATPVALVDPLAPGPYAVAFADYDAGAVEVGGADAPHSNYSYEARVRGRVWYPEDGGPWPVIVLLHGQHSTCALGDEEALIMVDDCDDEEGLNTPYPNHLGYAYLAEPLASHGYVVVSILAKEINQQNGSPDVGMWARGELVLATLDAVRTGAEGFPVDASRRADVTRVGIMGHSRGGEGVVTAAHVNAARPTGERHALRAIVALAPTDFNGRGAEGVPLLSLVPYCDADVYSLHGLRTFDHSRHLAPGSDTVQVLVRGTNHNNYNSLWYDDHGVARTGEDFSIPPPRACVNERDGGGWRWSPEATERESITHVGGFLRWQAGGERGLAPWFTGELALPDGACPSMPPCADAVVTSAVLADAERILVIDEDVPSAHATGGAVELTGFVSKRVCVRAGCHRLLYSSAPALELNWTSAAALTLRFEGADWSSRDVLSFRAANPTWNANGERLDVRVEVADGRGARATVRVADALALDPLPEPYVSTVGPPNKLALQSVRVPLADLDVDLADVREWTIAFEGEGSILLTDLLVQRERGVG